METRERANQLLAGLGKLLSVDGLCLNPEQNSCVLVFDQDILLSIEYDPPGERMFFYVFLEELPEKNAEPILRELMGANLFWMRTRGATLALSKGTNDAVLVYAHDLNDLDQTKFETLVENFVQQAENWKKRIAEAKAGTAGREGGPPVATERPPAGQPILYG